MGLDICHVKPSSKNKDTLDYFTLDELKTVPEFIKRYEHLLTETICENGEKIQVLYYSDKGNQRKRMNSEFCKTFVNCKLYFDIRSVYLASTFLEPKRNEELADLIQTFQTNFIDNFIEGESVFFATW